jgi:DNA-binding IscR family transcriptional regulator
MNRRDCYLLEALLELAATHPRALTVAEIARRRGLPGAFLARLLANAARYEVIVTTRGPSGGVQLARPPAQTMLTRAVPASPSTPVGGPATRWLAEELNRARASVLEPLTLADLVARERETDAFGYSI